MAGLAAGAAMPVGRRRRRETDASSSIGRLTGAADGGRALSRRPAGGGGYRLPRGQKTEHGRPGEEATVC